MIRINKLLTHANKINLLYITALILIGSDITQPAFAGVAEGSFSMPSLIIKHRGSSSNKIPNISCVYYKKSVLCDIQNHAWKNWGEDQPAGSIGTRFVIPQKGPAAAERSSDEISGFGDTTLEYGSKIHFGSITCKSERIGLTCTNESGGLMHLNREFYVLNEPVPQ